MRPWHIRRVRRPERRCGGPGALTRTSCETRLSPHLAGCPRGTRSAAGDAASFPAEDGALAGKAPMVAGEVAVLAEHAVARHHEAHRVLAHRRADGARRPRRADMAGDIGIGGG